MDFDALTKELADIERSPEKAATLEKDARELKEAVEKALQTVRRFVSSPRVNDQAPFQRLRVWFANHASQGASTNAISWGPVLQRLQQSRKSRPRCHTTVHQYMREFSPRWNFIVKAS